MNSKHLDDIKNIKIYENLLLLHGETYRALDWGSKESQLKRFEVLSEIGFDNGDSVLDVGCGLSDFNFWLEERFPNLNYSGLDLSPKMIEKSNKRYPNCRFFLGSILDVDFGAKQFDFLVASGIFVFRENDPLGYMKKTIERMYKLCIKGTAFNCLSNFTINNSDAEFTADPCDIFRFCKSISSRVILRHDYHPNDFTIYLYKNHT